MLYAIEMADGATLNAAFMPTHAKFAVAGKDVVLPVRFRDQVILIAETSIDLPCRPEHLRPDSLDGVTLVFPDIAAHVADLRYSPNINSDETVGSTGSYREIRPEDLRPA